MLPLSSEVTIITGYEHTYVFDVGSNSEVLDYLKGIDNLVIILSHFHPDHIQNIHQLNYQKLYVSKQTYKYTHAGEIVDREIVLQDSGLELHIFPVPSCHAKGCIGLTVNNFYAFLGDAVYGNVRSKEKEEYNYQILQNEIAVLEKISAERVFLSHRFNHINNKKGVLSYLREHLCK